MLFDYYFWKHKTLLCESQNQTENILVKIQSPLFQACTAQAQAVQTRSRFHAKSKHLSHGKL